VSMITRRVWTARADPRYNADVLGNLTDTLGVSIGCLVEDILLRGAKVCATERLLADQCLQLTIGDYNFTAPVRVIWTSDEDSGVAFSYGAHSAP
jgi:hypothetical protein